jgi:hypothetical protein
MSLKDEAASLRRTGRCSGILVERRPGRRALGAGGKACVLLAMIVLAGCNDDASTSADPTSTTVPAADVARLEGELPAGTETYEVRPAGSDALRLALTVTVPEGWSGAEGWVLRRNGGVDSREGIGITLWSAPDVTYGDPCRWSSSEIEAEPTVDFMADALSAQAMRDASTPVEIEVGDQSGQELQLSVPADIDIAECDVYDGTAYFQSWASADGQTARYHQGPGQRDLVRLVDVDGELLIVDAATWPELPADLQNELTAVLDSMRFEIVEP